MKKGPHLQLGGAFTYRRRQAKTDFKTVHPDEIIVFSIGKNFRFSGKKSVPMDMCRIRCKIVNSQLTVFKKKKRKKKLIYESIHTDSKTKFTKITDEKWIRKARRNIV